MPLVRMTHEASSTPDGKRLRLGRHPVKIRLKEIRQQHGYTSAAKLARELGWDTSTVTRDEAEPNRITLGSLYEYATLLGVKPRDILEDSDFTVFDSHETLEASIRRVHEIMLAKKLVLTPEKIASVVTFVYREAIKEPGPKRAARIDSIIESLVGYAATASSEKP